MDRKRRNRHGWLAAIVCVACFAGSVSALYGVLVLPLPRWRTAVVGLFGLGVLFSAVGGWLLGKLLWAAVRKGGMHMAAVVIVAALLVVCVFCALSILDGHPPVRHLLVDPVVLALTILLLVGSSYVVGFTFIPGGRNVGSGNRIFAVILLYGAVAAGVLLESAYPLPWAKVPPYPAREPRRMTFEEFMADARQEFPKEYRIEETQEGHIQIQYERPWIRWFPTEVHNDVIEAEGNRAVLSDGTVEVLGLDMYCREMDFILPDGTPRHVDPEDQDPHRGRPADDERLPWTERVGFWRLDGTPVPEDEWPREQGAWSRDILLYGSFPIETRGEIRPSSYGGDQRPIIFLPLRTQVAEKSSADIPIFDEEKNVWWRVVHFKFRAPIPGPLELRLAYLRSDEREYVFEGKEGDVIHLERESLQLLKIAEGSYERGSGQGDWDLVLAPREEPDDSAVTTAVFAALEHIYEPEPLRLNIRAVTRDGSVLDVPKINYFNQFLFVQFSCRPEEIERFVFIERAHVTQVRFLVTDIPFFPRENYGLDNMIDMRFPYRVRYPKDIQKSLPDGRLGSGMPQFIVKKPMEHPLNASLREILNHYYPGVWWVEEGKIRFGGRKNLQGRLREVFRPEPPHAGPASLRRTGSVGAGPGEGNANGS